MQAIEVPDQGHVPLLDVEGVLEKIVAFVAACDGDAGAAHARR
jgi:hypothetical protein